MKVKLFYPLFVLIFSGSLMSQDTSLTVMAQADELHSKFDNRGALELYKKITN